MKKRWIAVAIIAALGITVGVLRFAFPGQTVAWAARQGLPGMLSEWRNPIAPNRVVQWQAGPATPPDGPRPPNIILIVADDLGINDISLYGGGIAGGRVPTPHIDSLARDGVDFTTGYAGNATCSPSRAAMMTGRYPTRFGFEFTGIPPSFAATVGHAGGDTPHPVIFRDDLNHGIIPSAQMGVPQSEITIAEALKARGYRTLHIGKWHLGETDGLGPHAQGFDESLGMRAGGGMFLPEDHPDAVNAKLPFDPIDSFLWPNLPYAVQYNDDQRMVPVGHVTDYLTDNALAAISANKHRPFFLTLAYNAPHTPLQARRGDYDALAGIGDHTTRVYGAMVRQLDRRIGDVLARLKAEGIDDDTLVIFTSDNGGAWYTGIAGHNAPYRGWKATFFEGGIRVPMLMRWPGRIAPGTRSPAPASHLDLFATIAAVSGAAMPRDRAMDSVNLLGGIVSDLAPQPRTAPLFWRSGDYRAVRQGDWKLSVGRGSQRAWLYNLADDPTERHDLSAAQPERVAAMRALIDAQNRGLPPPLWPGLVEAPIRIDVPLNAPWRDGQDWIYWTN
jgi:arylsulfatase A-like enzyme